MADKEEPGSDEMYCSSCGEIIKAEAEICPECGVRQKSSPNQKDKVVAGLLAILLGGLGAHKFYLEKPGQGILYLCFAWTFIPAIIAFIEGIIYLTMNDDKFQEKHG